MRAPFVFVLTFFVTRSQGVHYVPILVTIGHSDIITPWSQGQDGCDGLLADFDGSCRHRRYRCRHRCNTIFRHRHIAQIVINRYPAEAPLLLLLFLYGMPRVLVSIPLKIASMLP